MMGGITSYADSAQVNLNNAASLSKLKFVNYLVGVDLKSTLLKIIIQMRVQLQLV